MVVAANTTKRIASVKGSAGGVSLEAVEGPK